jgi:anti-sigma28 factor (negative regulator of flagellin synthesis)
MSSISFNPSVSAANAIRPGDDSKARQVEPKSYTRPTDQVELSDAARQAASESPVRLDLVSRIRDEIANGSYETPGRIAIAADEMTRALRAG